MAISPIGPAVAEALGRVANGQTGGCDSGGGQGTGRLEERDGTIHDNTPDQNNPPRPNEPDGATGIGPAAGEAAAEQQKSIGRLDARA